MLPQVRVPPVELITQVAVEDLMLAPPVCAELLERREARHFALAAVQQLRHPVAVVVDLDVIARIEHLRLLLAEGQDEIVHDDVVLDGLLVVVAVAAQFADVLGGYVVQGAARFEMGVEVDVGGGDVHAQAAH